MEIVGLAELSVLIGYQSESFLMSDLLTYQKPGREEEPKQCENENLKDTEVKQVAFIYSKLA